MIYKLVAIIYRTFEDRGLSIPHFRAIISIIFLLFIHVVQAGLLLDIPSTYFLPWDPSGSKGEQFLGASLYFLTAFLLFAIIFSRNKVINIPVNQRQIENGQKVLPLYFAINLLFLLGLLIVHGIKRGSINL